MSLHEHGTRLRQVHLVVLRSEESLFSPGNNIEIRIKRSEKWIQQVLKKLGSES